MRGVGDDRGSVQELPCVWSLAGVLCAHPCDRQYDCDGCDLYHALSGRDGSALQTAGRRLNLSQKERDLDAEVGRIVSRLMDGCRLDLDRWYDSDGVWVCERRDGELDVGLVGCVWRILQPIRDLVAPGEGLTFEAQETCGWLVRTDRAIPIRIPVPGTVTLVNRSVLEKVRSEGRVNGPDSWVFRVRSNARPDEMSSLFRGENTLVWHLRKLRTLKGYLKEALDPSAIAAHVGPVMADGGEPEVNLEAILGSVRFGKLVEALL